MTATPCTNLRRDPPPSRYRVPRSNGVPNELLFREVNEQIARRGSPPDGNPGEIEIVCECGRRACEQRTLLPLSRYEAIRRFPTRFIQVCGQSAGDELAVEHGDGFVVVEKTGPSARIALRLDPRNRRRSVG